jgi:hypothetical protein
MLSPILQAQLAPKFLLNSPPHRHNLNTASLRAALLAPAVVRVFRDLHLANCVNPWSTLSDQHIYLPQLRDNLFRFVSFRCHLRSSVP